MLSGMQKKFGREYVKCLKPTEAARAAKYKDPGSAGFRNLRNPEVKAYIESLLPSDAEVKVTAERVLQEFTRIGLCDTSSFYFKNAHSVQQLKPFEQLTEAQKAVIKSIDYAEGKLELYDKLTALDRLGKHFKLFTDISEQNITFTQMGNVKINGVELKFNIGSLPPNSRGA